MLVFEGWQRSLDERRRVAIDNKTKDYANARPQSHGWGLNRDRINEVVLPASFDLTQDSRMRREIIVFACTLPSPLSNRDRGRVPRLILPSRILYSKGLL